MDKRTKKEMIERLARYRTASDRVNDDLGQLSSKILNLLEGSDGSEKNEIIINKEELGDLLQYILECAVHSHKYNTSLWDDYTKVIKMLGEASSETESY